MHKKRILFIEDEVFRNKAMFEMLKLDYYVDWVDSPKKALEKILHSETYDIIILDIMLPIDDESFNENEKIRCDNGDNTGIVLAEKFLNDEKTRDIPIIFESARNHLDISKLKNVKASLAKPFYYQDLKKEIERNLKK